MGFANEILDAIEIMVRQVVEDNTTKIYTGVCKTVSTSTCSLLINGKENTVKYYGGTPTVGTVYQVFIPFGNMSAAFIIVPGAGGQDPETGVSSVNGKTGAVVLTASDVGALPNTTIIPTKTSELDNDSGFVDADGASAAAPVQSVNTKTGAVVLTQDDVGDGTTYVRTHNDFTDVVKQQINTNEDNIAMLDSDMEAAQGDITTLKGNVTTLTTALHSKQDTITGGASTITDNNLTANHALVSNGSGKVGVSTVTSTELGYLGGVTSKVQTQLDSKQGVNDEIQAVRLRGGINSIINNASAVSINPAVNATGFLRYNGGNVQIFYDGYLMPFSNADIDMLFDGKSSTYINFGAGPSHAQTVCLWNEATQYPQNARVMYQTTSGVFRWYKALKESQGVIPEGDSTGVWEDVSTAHNTLSMDVRDLEVSLVIDSPLTLKWENGVSFYWRAATQNCSYYKIEVYDSVANQYVLVAERDNISRDEVVNTQYMGTQVSGTGKRFRIAFRAQHWQESGYLALTQIAFTGISGGIEGTLVNRGGSTMYGDLSPYTAGGASLGTSSKPWKEIQAQHIHGNINDTTSTFSQATSRTNISSGDKLSTIFGKIAKWFSDLGSLAFKSNVAKSDLTSDVQESLNKADTALQFAPVTSVNSKTGAVSLGASDVGAVSTSDVTTTLGTSTTKVPSEKAVSDALSAAGAGDMLKAIYDPDGSVATAGGIPAYVEANGGKIDTIKVNGAAQPITNKEVDITVPTNNNQLTNGAGYITAPEAPVTSVNGQTGDVTVTADIPDNLVKYTAVSDVQSVDGLNADTLEGHNAAYFATASGLSATNAQVTTNTNNISILTSSLSTANDNISVLQTAIGDKVDKSGGTMTGALVAQNNVDYTTAQVRNIIISTADPSGGSNGMLWIKYTP